MSFFLGIDLGTSYFKAGVFDENGQLLGLGRQRVEKTGKDGVICELAIPVFWKILRFTIAEAIQKAKIVSDDICALSYSSQANSFILLDEADRPLTSLILWPDERAAEITASLQRLSERSDFHKKTGLGLLPGKNAMIAKLDWIRKKRTAIWKKTKHIMSVSDYFIFVLTGQRVGDFGTSSMTGLLDVTARAWWTEALDTFHIIENFLSTPLQTGVLIGNISDKGADYTGLSRNSLLFAGSLDHYIVAIGAGLPYFNNISESTGTVLACVNYVKEYNPQKEINIAPGLDNEHYFQMAFNVNGAMALEWYQKEYAPEWTIPELLKQAAKVEPGSEGLEARPSANKFVWPDGFVNLQDKHSHPHFVRAILESTALSLWKLIKQLDPKNKCRAVVPSGGGARSRLWLQIKANLLNKDFLVPESEELGCKGAALLCAVGTSQFSDMQEAIQHQVRTKEIITPEPVETEKYKKWCNELILK